MKSSPLRVYPRLHQICIRRNIYTCSKRSHDEEDERRIIGVCIRCINYVCSHVHVARNGVNSKNVAIMPERGMRVPLPFQLDDIYISNVLTSVESWLIISGRMEGTKEAERRMANFRTISMDAGARRLWPFLMECVQEFCTVQGFRF